MPVILNVFICIVIPLLLFILVADRRVRLPILFLVVGMTAALIAVYYNGLIQSIYQYSPLQIVLYSAPLNEEFLKVIPLLLFVFIRKPDLKTSITIAVAIGVGFATIENFSYLLAYGVSDFSFILIRGFSTGIMHAITLCLFSVFLHRVSHLNILREIYVLIGVYAFATSFHGLFNLLVNSSQYPAIICGYFLPPLVALGFVLYLNWDRISAIVHRSSCR